MQYGGSEFKSNTGFGVGRSLDMWVQIVLLGVRTWLGAWERGNIHFGGWITCFWKRSKSGVWGLGNKINLLSGAYTLGQTVLRRT